MSHNCESCGMPIETGSYCQHCVDEAGVLQDFPTRFERMVQWQERRGSPRAQAEQETIAYMSKMPAWKDHPEVLARL
ncbi:hypothetical protein [Caulobacter sp. RL271]|jgi:hypothetical protein|uniref:Zinc ribbon domain-containing protein n=1 Tax=Caulobacter segnis TaxID=88688 RepID=A0ABY4ZW86_9CAUL|nr:hypothetical protein [Caulobacter segnis]USQ96186.1 hypothetical protein MZV50_00855 [Caulobacter segnis]